MKEQYPLCVPDNQDPRWGADIAGDPLFEGYIWLVPPLKCDPWVLLDESAPKLKKADVEQLRDRSGFARPKEELDGEIVWLCYKAGGKLMKLDLKVAKRMFKPNRETAIKSKNRVKLCGRLVPVIPERYYQKVSESAKWNIFLTNNLAGNILIRNKTPSRDYVEGDPAFISFDLTIPMTTPALVEYKFDIDRLMSQNLDAANQEPAFKLLAKIDPRPPTTPKRPAVEAQPAQTPTQAPSEPTTADSTQASHTAPAEPEKPAPKKRRPPAKKTGAAQNKRAKTASPPVVPSSPSNAVLQGVIPAQPNHATDASNKANVIHLVRKIREHPKFAMSRKNPLVGIPDQIGVGPTDEDTKKMLLNFAFFADFYLQGELGLQAAPSDIFVDSLFN